MLFPLLVQKWKLKIYATCPVQILTVTMLLANCVHLMKGSNNNVFFGGLHQFTMEEYVREEF
jgi:hypothetical protein